MVNGSSDLGLKIGYRTFWSLRSTRLAQPFYVTCSWCVVDGSTCVTKPQVNRITPRGTGSECGRSTDRAIGARATTPACWIACVPLPLGLPRQRSRHQTPATPVDRERGTVPTNRDTPHPSHRAPRQSRFQGD